MTLKYGVLAMVEARVGQEQAVADFLAGAEALAAAEPGTRTWYAFRVDNVTFGIFDTFETEDDRQAHLTGAIPAALVEHGPALLVREADISLIDILAST